MTKEEFIALSNARSHVLGLAGAVELLSRKADDKNYTFIMKTAIKAFDKMVGECFCEEKKDG